MHWPKYDAHEQVKIRCEQEAKIRCARVITYVWLPEKVHTRARPPVPFLDLGGYALW